MYLEKEGGGRKKVTRELQLGDIGRLNTEWHNFAEGVCVIKSLNYCVKYSSQIHSIDVRLKTCVVWELQFMQLKCDKDRPRGVPFHW